MPPVAWPNSALNPLVSTVNSVIASIDGALTATQIHMARSEERRVGKECRL